MHLKSVKTDNWFGSSASFIAKGLAIHDPLMLNTQHLQTALQYQGTVSKHTYPEHSTSYIVSSTTQCLHTMVAHTATLQSVERLTAA